MPAFLGVQLLASTGVCAALCASSTTASAALETYASITPTLTPERLGSGASLTISIRYSGGLLGIPLPVRRSVLRFPAGMSLDVPSLHSCHAARLRSHGAAGCPASSRLGTGRALVETRAGSQKITEDVGLQVFLGPPKNLEPTFEILAKGHTPVQEQIVFGGSVRNENAPYGEALVLSIPPIATLPLEPDASIVELSLTVGHDRGRAKGQSAVRVPRACPAGGFPFAAEFTYADGSKSTNTVTLPCPR